MRQRGFFLGWQIVAGLAAFALVCGIVGFSRYQVTKCRAELAEFKHAYGVLARSVATQNEAVNEWQKKATEAAQRGATARVQAQPVVEAAQKSADALAGAMRGMRPAECPTKGAVDAVRADLAGK